MKTYKCWAPEHGGDEKQASDIQVYDDQGPDAAAEAFHENWNSDGDHINHVTICVLDDGIVRTFDSQAEYEVSYYARERK